MAPDGTPEQTHKWPKLSVSVRPTVRRQLQAVAQFENRPAWRIVEDALKVYFDKMKPRDRETIEAFVSQSGRRNPEEAR